MPSFGTVGAVDAGSRKLSRGRAADRDRWRSAGCRQMPSADECLSLEWFRARAEGKIVIESRRCHHSAVRLRSSLG